MNSSRNFDATRLACSISSLQIVLKRRTRSHPDEFRRWLLLPGDEPQQFITCAPAWQLQDLRAMDAAWLDLAGRPLAALPQPVIRRAYIERPRGHSKTSDMAVQIAWILVAAPRGLSGLAAAADREQAKFLLDSLRRLVQANRLLLDDLQFLEHMVRNRQTGSRIEFIASDVSSSWGALPDFVVCDELSHWTKPDMWYSLLSSTAKKPKCTLSILTNAGFGRGWQWEVREHARTDPAWYFSSLQGPHAPWITEEWLAEQRALLPPPVFERLWLNIWQHAEGNFLTLEEAEACRHAERTSQAAGEPGRHYVAAIDYAEKHDFTVGCVCHREGDLFVIDRMDVVKPSPIQPTQISWVEDWIENINQCFHPVRFVVDEYQLLGTIQRLQNRFHIERFDFRGGTGNHQLAMLLRQLVIHRKLQWYPNCGAVDGPHRDDLETELASLLLKQSSSGRVRIDHRSDGKHHDDRAFALGVACLTLTREANGEDYLLLSPPDQSGQFLW